MIDVHINNLHINIEIRIDYQIYPYLCAYKSTYIIMKGCDAMTI